MTTDPLIFESRPALRNPVLLLSFAGWSDAGSAATTAVRYLSDQLMAKKFAAIDPEEFYDFYRQRPVVRLSESKIREIHWPNYEFFHGAGLGIERDFVLGVGIEPHLRWRTFCETMLRFRPRTAARKSLSLWALISTKCSTPGRYRSPAFPPTPNSWKAWTSLHRAIKDRPGSSASSPMLPEKRACRTRVCGHRCRTT